MVVPGVSRNLAEHQDIYYYSLSLKKTPKTVKGKEGQ